MALFMRIATRSWDSFGGGASLAAAAAWRDPGRAGGSGGRRSSAGAAAPVRVPAPSTDYFLECGLFPRSPSISITVCGVSWLRTWRGRQWGGGTCWLPEEGLGVCEAGAGRFGEQRCGARWREKNLALWPRTCPLRRERPL